MPTRYRAVAASHPWDWLVCVAVLLVAQVLGCNGRNADTTEPVTAPVERPAGASDGSNREAPNAAPAVAPEPLATPPEGSSSAIAPAVEPPWPVVEPVHRVSLAEGVAPIEFVLVPSQTFRMGLSRPRWIINVGMGETTHEVQTPSGVERRIASPEIPASSTATFEDGPGSQVRLSSAYWVATREVTRGQWAEVFGTSPTQQPQADCGIQCPVDNITWWSALEFADRLSLREGLAACYEGLGDNCAGSAALGDRTCTARAQALRRLSPAGCEGYRLLSDAEWEAAARAGSTTETYEGNLAALQHESDGTIVVTEQYAWLPGDDFITRFRALDGECAQDATLEALAWYCNNATVGGASCTHRVSSQFILTVDGGHCLGPQASGLLRPNAYGLHDMLGNVSEWVWDGWASPACVAANCPPQTDPVLFPESKARATRGGSWRDDVFRVQAGVRTHAHWDARAAGIRIGRTAPVPLYPDQASATWR